MDEDTSVFALSCLLQWRVDQLRAVRQSRFACLFLENRFATNVSKLNARIRQFNVNKILTKRKRLNYSGFYFFTPRRNFGLCLPLN